MDCDGIDTDCDGITDDDESLGASTWHPDMDGDGFDGATTACTAASGYLSDDSDCDDTDLDIHPGATETCDGVDEDCDDDDGASKNIFWSGHQAVRVEEGLVIHVHTR